MKLLRNGYTGVGGLPIDHFLQADFGMNELLGKKVFIPINKVSTVTGIKTCDEIESVNEATLVVLCRSELTLEL